MQIYKNILPANKREKARKIRKDMRKKKRKDFFTILFSLFLFFASVRLRGQIFLFPIISNLQAARLFSNIEIR